MFSGFSVLMSVYYKEKPNYFDLALHSILVDQTVLPNELVLICDGPLTSELDAVIEKYCVLFPTIIKLFRLEENGGLGRALNFGLTKCCYPIVARADSDDICVSTRFEIQTEYMKLHPDVSVISSYIDEFNEDWTRPFSEKRLPLDHESLIKRAKRRNPFNHMAVMFRRDDIIEAGSYQHVPYAEDYDLWVRTAALGKKFGNVDRVLVHARVGNGMIGRRSNKAQIASWKIINNHLLEGHMINRFERFCNGIVIRVFVYMPKWAKKMAYEKVLRKRYD